MRVLAFGLPDIDINLLPGGLPLGAFFGFLIPDPWSSLPTPQYPIDPSFQLDSSALHFSNLMAAAFAAHGLLIDDSHLLVITGAPLLSGSGLSSSISSLLSIWPSLSSSQDTTEEPANTTKAIPMKIAWRYNVFQPETRSVPSSNMKQSTSPSLDWTKSILSDKELIIKLERQMKVIPLTNPDYLSLIRSFLASLPLGTSCRIIIEDPFSPISSLTSLSEFSNLFSILKEFSGLIRMSTIITLLQRTVEPQMATTTTTLSMAIDGVLTLVDGLIEVTNCPKFLLPKSQSATNFISMALLKWKKPLRLPNYTTWLPPISTGGVWQASLSRRKGIALLPVTLPIDEDEGVLNTTTSCSTIPTW